MARAADDASLTSSGVLAGTPHYMSPEQARGEPVDFRSDLFSLGSLVFAMLTGQPPVNRELGSETIRTIATQPMPPVRTVAADAPEWAERLVGWLHQPKPEDRPESARQVAETLEQCLKHVRSPQVEGLPERLTRAEETEMGHPNDKRLFSLIALGLFLAVFLTPPLVAMTTRGEWALAFGGVAACLALFFGCLSWGEKISKLVVVTLGGLVVVAGLGLAATWFYMNQQDSRFQEAKRDAMQREAISAEEQQKLVDKAVALQNQRKEAEKEKADPKGKDPLSGGGYPGMGGPPGGMAGPGAGMPGGDGPPGLELPGFVSPSTPGMGGPPGMGFGRGGNAGPNNTTFAEELKKALGEELPVPEWKKPKYTPFPQLSGTWIATKAYLNGEEFKSQEKRFKGQDKRQGIVLVCYGESIVIRMGRNFNTPELELGSGQIKLVPGGKDKTFMVRGYSSNPNANGYKQSPIFCTYQIDGEKLSIAFSESEPKLGPLKGQDYYEFKAFSQRFPEELDVTQPISGKKFFSSSVGWISFPLLKGVWFCESAQFSRETSLNYSKLDPKRFVLTGEGNGLVLYFQATRQRARSAEPDVKDGFPATTWRFHSWSPGGKGPIEAGKLPQFGTAGIEYLNYEYKGDLLHLTVADSIEGLGRDGKNDVFVFKKVTENWLEEEWKGEKLEKKLEIHAQKDKPMSLPEMSQEKPKDGGKESGKPKEVPAGKEPERAADGKEKGK